MMKEANQPIVDKVCPGADNPNKYCAYLLDGALLEKALETHTYNGDNVIQVYMDDFVCEKKEDNLAVDSIAVPGESDFLAHAARFGFRCPVESSKGWVETFLRGHLHLAWFINDNIVWAVKNLALYESTETWVDGVLYQVNPRFLASAIVDLRTACLEGEQDKRVVGWARPTLLAEEKTDD